MSLTKKIISFLVSLMILSTTALASSVTPIASDMGSNEAFAKLDNKLSTKITTDLKHEGENVFYITEEGQAKQHAKDNVRGIIHIEIVQPTKKSCYVGKWWYEGTGSVYGLNIKTENGNNLYIYPNGALEDETLDCYETSGSEPHIDYIEIMLGTGFVEDEVDPNAGTGTGSTEPEITIDPVDEPEDTSIDLYGAKYAYIFGYEPRISVDENGAVESVEIDMAPNGGVTVEEVSAMLMRLLDQTGNTKTKTYPVTNAMKAYAGTWYERGLAYLCSVNAFDERETVNTGYATRGQIAKLVACALKLNRTKTTTFADIDGNLYKEYIEKVNRYGYMNGTSDTTFEPDAYMTRAEFCQLFNNILGKSAYGLTVQNADGTTYEVTPATYHIVDMDGFSKNDWEYKACMKATSAYDEDNNVDLQTREDNIRNKADHFDAQKEY